MSARVAAAGAWVARRVRYALRGPDGEKGVIAILAALLLTVMIMGTAFAVDITGRVMELRRDQATADLGALDASWGIGPGTYQTLAYASALRNGVDRSKTGVSVSAQLATYANGTCTVGGASPNAVQVAVTTPYNDFFGATHSELTRYACATDSGKAQFSIGTTLIDVNAGLNALGTSSTLGLVGYQGLASGNVTLGALATQLGFGALSPDQVLAQNLTVGQLLSASSGLLNSSGNPTAAAQLSALGAALNLASRGSTLVNLGQVLNLQQGQGVGLGTGINLLQLFQGGLQLANGNAGITFSNSIALGDLTGVSTHVTAIKPPTMSAYGPVGINATNSQASVVITIGLSIPLVATVNLPIVMTLGGATGTLTAIDCNNATPTDIKLSTAFPAANVTVGSATATNLLGVTVPVSGTISLTNTTAAAPPVMEPTNFNFIPPGNTPNPTTPTPVSASSTINSANVNLNLAGIGLTGAVLDPVVALVLPTVINTVANTLGASFGINTDTADYLGNKASCGAPSLVQ